MTFEEALKRLAEKEPEKFQIRTNINEAFLWTDGHYKAGVAFELLGQDDLDEIATILGWEYALTWDENGEWAYYCAVKNTSGVSYARAFIYSENESYPTKLSAAKAALIAIVEHEYPIQGEK